MKKYALYFFAAALIMAGCKKNTYNITDREGIEGKALVKIGLFSMYSVATNVLIYNNDERISGVLASPYPYPGGGLNTSGGSNGDYFATTPGPNKFALYTTNAGTANVISKIFETTTTLVEGQRQTLYIADTAANTVAILAPDNASTPDSGIARIRFINLIPNSVSVDFYKGTTLLKSNVKYKDFTEFFDVPASTVDSFSIRPAGSAPGSALSATAYYRLTLNTNRRILSFLSRGYIGATGTRVPAVSVSVNQ